MISPALPLTFDNVFEVVKTVRNWREVAKGLMGWDEIWDDEDRKKLDTIERQHISNEARLKPVVEAFLLGEGSYQPSWRMLIHALYKAGETNVAERIKTNAKPRQGERVYQGLRLRVARSVWGGSQAPISFITNVIYLVQFSKQSL